MMLFLSVQRLMTNEAIVSLNVLKLLKIFKGQE